MDGGLDPDFGVWSGLGRAVVGELGGSFGEGFGGLVCWDMGLLWFGGMRDGYVLC